jgi:hypothetical protein
MLAAVVTSPFLLGTINFTTGEIVSDPNYVALFQQEPSYGQKVVFTDVSDGTIVLPPIPLTPLQAEIARAQAAEAANLAQDLVDEANLAIEVSRAEGAETVNSTNIANEIIRAIAADNTNAAAIAAEIVRAQTAEGTLLQQLAAIQSSLLPSGTFTLDLNQSGNMF